MPNTLYITGAGVSAESGIPTFRGEDGYWTIGSRNYTPMEMATRQMYESNPAEFLAWYYHRFVTYRHHGPNAVHNWLKDKNLITQNIDGLDGKAGNQDYISIHGRIDKVTLYHEQGPDVEKFDAPWDHVDEANLKASLLDIFRIPKSGPVLNQSLKPYVLLFDEFYSDLYQIGKAQQRMWDADKIVFMGTSFSVNITEMALNVARHNELPIEVVDPSPAHVLHDKVDYKVMTASQYVESQS